GSPKPFPARASLRIKSILKSPRRPSSLASIRAGFANFAGDAFIGRGVADVEFLAHICGSAGSWLSGLRGRREAVLRVWSRLLLRTHPARTVGRRSRGIQADGRQYSRFVRHVELASAVGRGVARFHRRDEYASRSRVAIAQTARKWIENHPASGSGHSQR